MKIDLIDIITKDGAVYPFEYSLDLHDLKIQNGFPFAKPILVKGRVTNRAGVLELQMTADARIFYKCARCAVDTSKDYHADIFYILSSDADNSDMDSAFPIEGTCVDIDRAVESYIILNYDMVNLCRPDCKGLCHICGGDLNEHSCNCKESSDDPRLSPLRDLLEKMKNQ